MIIDINEQISNLEKRRDELNELWSQTTDADEIEKIEYWEAKLTQKLLFLRQIKAHKEASAVIVEPATDEEESRVKKSLDALNQIIQKEQTFDATIITVTEMLKSADTVISTADKGSPKTD